MNEIAFLSTDDLEGYVIDDDLAHAPLRELGWSVTTIPWRQRDVEWERFAGVIIRTPWDYHRHLPEFLQALGRIDAATALANSLRLVCWNAEKTYLRDLEKRGARIVPTLWGERGFQLNECTSWFAELGADELVVKPTVSANADDTLRLRADQLDPQLAQKFGERGFMVQPFMQSIVEEGEFSLFYFHARYSHAVLKKPRARDFRVQEEHGGLIRPTQPPPEVIEAGERVMRSLDEKPLYARIDLVRNGAAFALMEVELIEPSLYLRTDTGAPSRFAAAIESWLNT